MPPKRQARPSTPPSAGKKGKRAKPEQASIESFFSSPTKPRVNGTPKQENDNSVISFVDSDDEYTPQRDKPIPSNATSAQGSVNRGTEGDVMKLDKGKGKVSSPVNSGGLDYNDGIGRRSSSLPSMNGSSSSILEVPSVKLEQQPSSKRESKSISSVFSRPQTPPRLDQKPNVCSPSTPSRSSGITNISYGAVEPIDFDRDAFLFRPSEIDVSDWPKGRLPYSVLVGVYVQVSSTRSRLTIVRVLTKFVFTYAVWQ